MSLQNVNTAITLLRLTPLERFRCWLIGKTILVLGPPRTGKTSFLNYLETPSLGVEHETPQTISVEPRDSRAIEIGPERSPRILRVYQPLDTPGNYPPPARELVAHYKPDCIIIVLDASKLDSSISWLDEFCDHLHQALSHDSLAWNLQSVARKLRKVVILMNKWDKVDPADQKKFQDGIKQVVESYKRQLSGFPGTNHISILPCSLVKNNQGSELIDQVLMTIAESLR